MKYLFRGGTVVSGRGTRRADILVEGEKILEVGRNITRKADQIIDVTGMLLMPGFIDAHTHFDLDVCNTTTADNFTTGSRAALRGAACRAAAYFHPASLTPSGSSRSPGTAASSCSPLPSAYQ